MIMPTMKSIIYRGKRIG